MGYSGVNHLHGNHVVLRSHQEMFVRSSTAIESGGPNKLDGKTLTQIRD
jgi:hypothetical protein